MKRMLLALFAAAALLAGGAAAQIAEPTIWYEIAAVDGARLGHASREVAARADGGRETIASQRLYLSEEGGSNAVVTVRTVTREDAAGRTRAIESVTSAGRFPTRVRARIENGVAHVVRETQADRSRFAVVLPEAVRFDGGEGLLRDWDRAGPLEFDNFSVVALGVERVVMRPTGGANEALRLRYEGAQLRGVARVRWDERGRIVEAVQPLFGLSVRIAVTDEANASRLHRPFRVVPNTMVRAAYRIPASAQRGHIRYRFGFGEGLTFTPPQTGEQRVSEGDDGVTLDICAGCGPGLPSDPAYLADALRPTMWLQSDHRRLQAIAAPVARLDTSDARKMELLIERARPYLGEVDFRGHYSALETVSRRAGDCTEAAVLLAALGRAAGIPTRVVSGLTYTSARYHGVSNAFMPHSWTLAWVDGEWRSFDLALDAFDSTHIALTIGDGDASSIAAASQLASLLRWEGLAEIRGE